MLISLQSQLILSLKNGLCCQFLHTNTNAVKVELQIDIGCIEKVQEDPECMDIRFCPRKGTRRKKEIGQMNCIKIEMQVCDSILILQQKKGKGLKMVIEI